MTSSKTRRELRDVSEMERRRSSPASCVRVLLYQYHLWGPSRYRKTKRARVPAGYFLRSRARAIGAVRLARPAAARGVSCSSVGSVLVGPSEAAPVRQ
jgi:hypothetical protein